MKINVDLKLEFDVIKDIPKDEVKKVVENTLEGWLKGKVYYEVLGIFLGKEIIYIPAMDK